MKLIRFGDIKIISKKMGWVCLNVVMGKSFKTEFTIKVSQGQIQTMYQPIPTTENSDTSISEYKHVQECLSRFWKTHAGTYSETGISREGYGLSFPTYL